MATETYQLMKIVCRGAAENQTHDFLLVCHLRGLEVTGTVDII